MFSYSSSTLFFYSIQYKYTMFFLDDIDIINRISTGNIDRKPDVFVQLSVPNEFTPHGKFNIGITAGIETTICAAQWIEGLNRMDMNIVPSQHAKNVFWGK